MMTCMSLCTLLTWVRLHTWMTQHCTWVWNFRGILSWLWCCQVSAGVVQTEREQCQTWGPHLRLHALWRLLLSLLLSLQHPQGERVSDQKYIQHDRQVMNSQTLCAINVCVFYKMATSLARSGYRCWSFKSRSTYCYWTTSGQGHLVLTCTRLSSWDSPGRQCRWDKCFLEEAA